VNYADRLSDSELAIFLLHGVVEKNTYKVRNYTRKHLERDYFHSFLKSLKERGNPLSMDEVIELSRAGKPWPRRSFVISFDDGFENNYSVAAPVLEDLNIPAVFYVSTQFVGENAMSWIDQIEWLLESQSEGKLKLPWNESIRTFSSPKDKIELLSDIRVKVKSDPQTDLNMFVSDIFQQLGHRLITQSEDPLDLKMSWKEVTEIHHHKLFCIGGHSHRHINLAFLSEPELRKEIGLSIELLKTKAGIRSAHYSYPEGLEYCYSSSVINNLKDEGVLWFLVAQCSTQFPFEVQVHSERRG